MDTPDLRPIPELDPAGCDGELFAQVWRRVAPGEGCPIEVVGAATPVLSPEQEIAPPEAPSCPVTGPGQPPETGICPVCFGGGGREASQLQELVRECLAGRAAYGAAARRDSRQRTELAALARKKLRQAKRLSAACFLMTGVRYWPAGDLPPTRPMDFFALLRERFLAEQRLAVRLTELGQRAGDTCLRELYLSLAEETMELVHSIRLTVERET